MGSRKGEMMGVRMPPSKHKNERWVDEKSAHLLKNSSRYGAVELVCNIQKMKLSLCLLFELAHGSMAIFCFFLSSVV